MRCWRADDAPAFRNYLDRNNDHLRPYVPWMSEEPQPLEKTREKIAEYIRQFEAGEEFRYALFDREGSLIGDLLISTRNGPESREIGYSICKDHTGKGFGFEAACMLTRTAFEHCETAIVELHCSPDNAASIRIAKKLGFQLREIREKDFRNSEGIMSDTMYWDLLPSDYPASAAASVRIQAFDQQGNELD